jgi:hypothetical protein
MIQYNMNLGGREVNRRAADTSTKGRQLNIDHADRTPRETLEERLEKNAK